MRQYPSVDSVIAFITATVAVFCAAFLAAVVTHRLDPQIAARDQSKITIVPGPARPSAIDFAETQSRNASSVPRSFIVSDTQSSSNHLISSTENQVLPLWELTNSLRTKLRDQIRDNVWADKSETKLALWRGFIASPTSQISSSEIYCASTMCEMVISPPKEAGFAEVNQVTGSLQDTAFDSYLARNGLTLSTVAFGSNQQGAPAINLYLQRID